MVAPMIPDSSVLGTASLIPYVRERLAIPGRKPARQPGDVKLKVLGDAPGDYVKVKSR